MNFPIATVAIQVMDGLSKTNLTEWYAAVEPMPFEMAMSSAGAVVSNSNIA
jgi:hypothetical protein